MALTPGTRLGVYEVTAQIGVGGMGEVYRATDTKLKRHVAIKILPSSLAADPDRLARFQREAEVLASLNHPNIAAIYGLEDADGVKALVMELVEGEDLAQRLARGAVPLAEALPIAKQVAEALEAAHEQDIIHRDLKPANIRVRDDGTVKLLDFGLAKALEPPRSATDVSQSPTITSPAMMTGDGVLLGTAAYMSPEQARGKPVDKRADIWAFGCVLYEMLTGRPPFAGDTIVDTIAGILDREPDWQALPPTTAPGVVRLLKRCLDKDARHRLRDVGDARTDLEDLDRVAPFSSAPRTRVARRGLVLLASLAALLSLTAVTYWAVSRGSDLRLPATLPSAPTPLTTYPGSELFPSFSPDGDQVAFTWLGERRDNWDIYIKVVGSAGPPLRLTSHPAVERFAVWSPDGREIAFGRERAIFLISSLGGVERKLVDFEVSSPMSWSPDGKWIAATQPGDGDQAGGIFLIPGDGGEHRRITSRTLPAHDFSPSFSPDGKRLAFASCVGGGGGRSIGVSGTGLLSGSFGSLSCDIQVTEINQAYAPTTGSRRLSSFGGLAWTPDGKAIVYGSLPSLWRVSASGLSEPEQLPFLTSATQPATSFRRRRLAYTQVDYDSDVWIFENGRGSRRHLSSTRPDRGAMFSPDGTRIAFVSARSGIEEIWVTNTDGTQPLQLTSSGGRSAGTPRWSPDGHWIVYDVVTPSATRDIFIVDAAGGRPRPLVVHPAQDRVPSWSRNGEFIYFTSNRNAGKDEIFRVAVSGGDPIQVTDQGGYVAFESPDSAMLYYTKRASGSSPLFVRSLSGGSERQVLDSVYHRNFVVAAAGIYFIDGAADDGRFPLKFLELSSGKTKILTQIDGSPELDLSISPDGQRALYTLGEQTSADLMLVENFR